MNQTVHQIFWSGLLLFGLAFHATEANGATKSGGAKVYSYVGINGEPHDFEVYFPKEEMRSEKAPCAVFFHGGGWTGGSRNQFSSIAEYFASRGMVSITADYSVHSKEAQKTLPAGESKKRVCVIDGKSVIRWVKQHADELGIDPARIVAGGASAGGHIAVLSMLDETYGNPKDPQGIDTDVKAFLLFCPAFTLLEKDRAPDVNVFNHLDKPVPPALFIVGETDKWKIASDALVKVLSQKGIKVENWMAADEGHMFFRKGPWQDVCLKKADDFLIAHGLLAGESPLAHPAAGKQLQRLSEK